MQWGKIQYYNNSGGGRTPYSNKPRIYEVEGLTDHLSEFLRPQGRVQVDHIPILSVCIMERRLIWRDHNYCGFIPFENKDIVLFGLMGLMVIQVGEVNHHVLFSWERIGNREKIYC